MKINQLSVIELEKFFIKIYENACELIEEAEILYSHQKYARSYLCAHTALEELAKLPILKNTATKVFNKQKVDWNLVNKRINRHDSKIIMGYSMVDYYFYLIKNHKDSEDETTAITEDMGFIEAVKILIEEFDFTDSDLSLESYITERNLKEEGKYIYTSAKLLKEYREGSMYTDYDGQDYIKPSDKIDKGICEYGLINVYIQKKFIESTKFHINGLKPFKYEVVEKEEIIDSSSKRVK